MSGEQAGAKQKPAAVLVILQHARGLELLSQLWGFAVGYHSHSMKGLLESTGNFQVTCTCRRYLCVVYGVTATHAVTNGHTWSHIVTPVL